MWSIDDGMSPQRCLLPAYLYCLLRQMTLAMDIASPLVRLRITFKASGE